jgi:hypothetical protein
MEPDKRRYQRLDAAGLTVRVTSRESEAGLTSPCHPGLAVDFSRGGVCIVLADKLTFDTVWCVELQFDGIVVAEALAVLQHRQQEDDHVSYRAGLCFHPDTADEIRQLVEVEDRLRQRMAESTAILGQGHDSFH